MTDITRVLMLSHRHEPVLCVCYMAGCRGPGTSTHPDDLSEKTVAKPEAPIIPPDVQLVTIDTHCL